MLAIAREVYRRVRRLVPGRPKRAAPARAPMAYWEDRARKYGRRSVLNIGHSEAEYDAVTRMQGARILPLLRASLNGKEEVVVDLGCGPGRFTSALAEAIDGRAIGVDPVRRLLALADPGANTEYRVMSEGVIPVDTATVDVMWVCLVLGGLVDDQVLDATVREIARALKPDGLLFLVENTSDKPDGEHWRFRAVSVYQALFPWAPLRHLSDYRDMDERISILAGRRRP